MMSSAPARVNPAARPAPPGTGKIPFAFRADPVALDGLGLDSTARSTFVLILDNAKDRGWTSRLSNATIGKILGRCPMTISRALRRLEAAGLVRRELIAGGRVRTGIAVTWAGVRRDDLTGHPAVRREGLTGSARALEGLGASADLIRSPTQSRPSDGGDSLSTGGKEAADYLRRCVESAKRGEPMPEPPGPLAGAAPSPAFANRETEPPTGGCATPPASPTARGVGGIPLSPAPTPTAPPDAFLPSVGRMVAALGERLKADDVGRRRVGPAKLARQLAQVRRRHGRAPR